MERTSKIQIMPPDDDMFHLIMVYMSILNKRFGSAGMRDVLVQSSIVAESVDSALRGKSYNRGIRLYKIFYEP